MTSLLAAGGAVIGIVVLFAGVVWLAERKAEAELREGQKDETMRKLRDAIEADNRARERIARGELLNDDGYKRD